MYHKARFQIMHIVLHRLNTHEKLLGLAIISDTLAFTRLPILSKK